MLLKVENLCKSFNNKIILNNINLEVDNGEIISIVGKSGAGKTTILRCITGLEKPDSGNILIDGKFLCKTENNNIIYSTKKELFDIRKNIGMVFQNYHLFPHLTVLENITITLTSVYNMSKFDAEEKAMKMLKKLDMNEKFNSRPFELSGGQKQRVAIARSCVTNPKLLFFDEPTAALDSELIKDIVKIIRNFSYDGIGILIISHDEKFVRDVSDKVVLIENGFVKSYMTCDEYSNIIKN